MTSDLSPIEFRPVWYASKDKFESVTKFIILDDRGTLTLGPGALRFAGRSRRWKCAISST
jgi:hypothetical protein